MTWSDGTCWYSPDPAGPTVETYTIFEGTSEIQRLVISKAISGLRVE
jgi:hypothetical protein